jgi:hypothetical protein
MDPRSDGRLGFAMVSKTKGAVAGMIRRLRLPLVDPPKAHHQPRPSKGKYH